MPCVDHDVIVVKHLFKLSLGNSAWDNDGWTNNYYFVPSPVEFEVFQEMLSKHYDRAENTGPFLKNLRFNLWIVDGGAILRDQKLSNPKLHLDSCPIQTIDHLSSGAVELFTNGCESCGVKVVDELAKLIPKAWEEVKICRGIKAGETVTITGGFFNNSANAYLGRITVWRDLTSNKVKDLTFHKIKEYEPKKWPVLNKGFSGGSWYNGKLYVCWPNRVAVVDPKSKFAITQHFDSPFFNDLHHVHACKHGIWVANTGMDSVDHLSFDNRLLSRSPLVAETEKFHSTTDVRDQATHTKLRGTDKVHVNHVEVIDNASKKDASGKVLSTDVSKYIVRATLLQSKQIVEIQQDRDQLPKVIAQLKDKSPPHEGFELAVPYFGMRKMWWNSTVDGLVTATDAITGNTVETWNLCKYVDIPRGWTRGLCILEDGFLVGSTVIRGTSKEWLQKHENEWNFETEDSRTAVVYVPFDHEDACAVAVDVLSNRDAKIYSLLREEIH